ncbi:MAG: peroxiredoxin [Nitrososphaerota archaeon]|nr:peroxiredoxin [Candidatus Calditenuaceae archaeon]MDW8073643.1 peroxiredoxin [Nitrososphaerota archaeon]
MPVKVGDNAPDFELVDQDRKLRKLSEFRGKKVVLAFFPGAFTSVCTKEMCTFRDSLSEFSKLDAVVLGISVNDPFTLKAFAESNRLGYTLLSDYSRSVSRSYGGVHDDFLGMKGYSVAKRAVFILDREGVVRYAWVSEDPLKEPNYKEVAEALSKIS